MTVKRLQSNQKSRLRQQIEKLVAKDKASTSLPISSEQMQKLLYELKVHQLELELQNEELRRSQHELEISRGRYRSLYEQAPIGYLTLNDQGLILKTNFKAAALFGSTRSALLKKPLSNFIFNEDQDAFYFLRKQLGKTTETHCLDCRLKQSDRSFIWIHLQATPSQNLEYLVTLEDITERKQSEEALRSASSYTRSLLEASLDPLVTISPDGKITDVNQASVRVTGMPREKLLGTDFSSYFTDPEKARNGYRQVFTVGFVNDYPLAIRHVSGKTTEVIYNASVYRDEAGNVKGVFAAARDVTERNRAEKNLQKVHIELERRVAERTTDLQQLNEQLHKMTFELVWAEERERERIAGELHDQVGQSLLLAKMKLDALSDENLPVPLRNYAEEACSLLENSIQDIRSLTFRMRPPILDSSGIETALEWLCSSLSNDYDLQIHFSDDDQPKPLSPEIRYSMYQAVRELLLNVVKHAGTEKAELKIKAEGQNIVVQVTDNGVGFDHPDAQLNHVQNGGYGLYNVRQRILQMGGRFMIESTSGIGTSVTLIVPLANI